MSMTDPIADMLTRIRNAVSAKHESVVMPSSKVKVAIASVLKEEGYIRDFEVAEEENRRVLRVKLNYSAGKQPVLNGLQRVSKPGLRVYTKADRVPRVLGGLGVAVLSTSQGLMTDREARKRRMGGEVLCFVW